MGCCTSHSPENNIHRNNSWIIESINDTLMKNRDDPCFKYIALLNLENINDNIIELENLKLNPLAYAIVTGDIEMLKYLHHDLGACFKITEDRLEMQEANIFELLIVNFNEKIMRYFLKHYFQHRKIQPRHDTDNTLNFTTTESCKHKKYIIPIHYASEIGNIDFIKFIYKYYSGKTLPEEFSLNTINEDTGENCALISCRRCNFNLMVCLHKLKANFFIKNKNSENAIHLALTGCK